MLTRSRERSDHVGLLGIGAAALAVGCCAGLPLLAGAAASIGTAAAIGIGAGGIVAVGAVPALNRSSQQCVSGGPTY
jgi:hypothetical protein